VVRMLIRLMVVLKLENKFMSKNLKNKNKKGFSTLLVVILLGGVALTLALTLATSSVWSLRGSIDTRNSNKAKGLVNSCAEIALEIIRENNNYTGSSGVVLNGDTCNYVVTNTGGTTRGIAVVGTVNGIIHNLNITTSTFNPLVISSWQENI